MCGSTHSATGRSMPLPVSVARCCVRSSTAARLKGPLRRALFVEHQSNITPSDFVVSLINKSP